MTERKIKELCKMALESSNKPLSKEQKEVLKLAIDKSETVEELLFTAILSNIVS